LADDLAELGVHGGHGRRGLLDHGHLAPAAGEGLGHLQADVAGPHDQRPARPAGRDGLLDSEHVSHAVQDMHPGQVQAGDRWARGDRAGTDDQPVIADDVLVAVGVGDHDPSGGRVDPVGGVVQPQFHPGPL
jgi:hypothetical protein